MSERGLHCHSCGASIAARIDAFSTLRRVTSDCKPWPAGGFLAACAGCGLVQKLTDRNWEEECSKIYGAYAIYECADGSEQQVMDSASGGLSFRSDLILRRLFSERTLPGRGRLLDIGCGNGALLRSAARVAPGWSLVGTEMSERHRSQVEAINGVEKLYAVSPEEVPGRFHLITMLHVLEHIPDPAGYLSRLVDKLEPGGMILIQVPDLNRNPFDLLIADHCSHFSSGSLHGVLVRAGIAMQVTTGNWIAKELTAVAQAGRKNSGSPSAPEVRLTNAVEWIQEIVQRARMISKNSPFGLFGTSIAASWLFGELGDRVSFFVDEDPHRYGREYLGKPVIQPRDIPTEGHVLVAMPPAQARELVLRLESEGYRCSWHIPPPFLSVGI